MVCVLPVHTMWSPWVLLKRKVVVCAEASARQATRTKAEADDAHHIVKLTGYQFV